MIRFWRFAASIWLLCTLLCAAMVILGRMQALPESLPGLESCGGVPCYHGINVDKTAWQDAITVLRQHGKLIVHSESLPAQQYEFIDGLTQISAVTSDGQIISWVRVDFPFSDPHAPTIGQLIALYGIPEIANFTPSQSILLNYPKMRIAFNILPNLPMHLSLETPIISMGVFGTEVDALSYHAWHGFTTRDPVP